MKILFNLFFSLLVSAQARADVWYDCKAAGGYPPGLTIEIKSGVWARITVGDQSHGYKPCVVKFQSLDQDMVIFDNSEGEYSAQTRLRECNQAYKSFGGDFAWLKLHKSMLMESTAPKLGRALTRTQSFTSQYVCTRAR